MSQSARKSNFQLPFPDFSALLHLGLLRKQIREDLSGSGHIHLPGQPTYRRSTPRPLQVHSRSPQERRNQQRDTKWAIAIIAR